MEGEKRFEKVDGKERKEGWKGKRKVHFYLNVGAIRLVEGIRSTVLSSDTIPLRVQSIFMYI